MWGALLTRLPLLARAFGLMKEHPVITTVGGVGIGSMFLHGKDKEGQTQEQSQQQTQPQEQQSQQSQQKQQAQSSAKPKAKSKGGSGGGASGNLPPLEEVLNQLGGVQPPMPAPTGGVGLQQDGGGEGGSVLSRIANQIQDLFVDLDKHRQMYDALSQQYLQANDIYEKQLLQTMQMVPFLVAKTPLNNITTEDLNEHLNSLLTSMPYTDAIEKVNQLTKGYYVAKMNGVDPKSLSTTDLMMIADNPALAKSVNDNVVQFLEQMGEILKYKIKSNMDKVGAIKDQYQNILKELEEKGKLYKEIIDAFKAEMNLDFNRYKFDANLAFKEQSHADTISLGKAKLAETSDYHNKMTNLKQQEVEIRKEALEKKGGGGKQDPISEAEAEAAKIVKKQ